MRLGGRARDEFVATGSRFGRGEHEGGGDRVLMERKGDCVTGTGFSRGGPRPPEARWIEFMAGKAGSEDDVGLSLIVKLGRVQALLASLVSVALGGAKVVNAGEPPEEGGGGGGGMAWRSRSAFISSSCFTSSLDPAFGWGGGAMLSLSLP